MSRRQTGQAVSLFPFLAVLVSAMGALILLLLVTTRKLRNDAVSRAQAEQQLVQAAQQAEAEANRLAIAMPVPPDDPAFHSDAALFVIAVPSPAKQLLPPPPEPEPDRTMEKELLRNEWENRLAEMRRNWDKLQHRLKERQAHVKSQALTEEQLQAELARLQELINRLRQEKDEIVQRTEQAQLTKKSIAEQIADLQAELARLKQENAEQSTKFQLVPYAGSSPTKRRPIVIECEANTIRFASEDIPLSARDMSGFSSEYNPVRAGTDALITYWEQQRQMASSLAAMQPEPYLLFVIRPGGTVSYYVTRRMLEGLQIDSGYELVTQSQELIWPKSTPDAKTACEEAIREALAVRSRVIPVTPEARLPVSEELQYEGQNGQFVLDEVEKLRNPEQKLFVGGQRVTRHNGHRPGAFGYKPPTAPDRGGFVGPRLADLKEEFGRPASRRPSSPQEIPVERRLAGRPFPTDPPPRIGPVKPIPEGFGSTQVGTPIDPQHMRLMTPEEIARLQSRSSNYSRPYGNVRDDGRGEGQSEGEATSQFGDEGELNDLLGSNDRSHPRRPRHHPPTNAAESPHSSAQDQGDGQPGGDRTAAVETTSDPSMSGEWKPHGAAGGKGTWSGDLSSDAAPAEIPVQPGGTGSGGNAKQSHSSSDPLAQHLPRPLPDPSPHTIAAERFVVVTIDANQARIGHREIPIEVGISDVELQAQFSEELSTLAHRWGRPPAGFHWQPALRYRVLPGGNQYYAYLKSASDTWEYRSTLEYVFD